MAGKTAPSEQVRDGHHRLGASMLLAGPPQSKGDPTLATTEFIGHLDAAIASLDVEIAKLTLVRDNVAELRAGFAQPPSDEFVAFETLAKTVVAHPKGGAANMVARKPTTAAAAKRADDAEQQRQARSASQPKTGASRYDYVEVARVANAAVRAGVSPTQAVRRHFNVTDAMGTYLIKAARKQGHEIGRLGANKPLKPASPPSSNVTPIAASKAFTPDDTLRIIDGG